ncbi:hypothetical protein ACFSVJ_22035 [Prauserella oleivorans]
MVGREVSFARPAGHHRGAHVQGAERGQGGGRVEIGHVVSGEFESASGGVQVAGGEEGFGAHVCHGGQQQRVLGDLGGRAHQVDQAGGQIQVAELERHAVSSPQRQGQ